jgi:hypothetical protein
MYIEMAAYIYTGNGTNRKGKWQLLFVCSKWKTEMANFRLFGETENESFIFLGRQTINIKRFIFVKTVNKYFFCKI